MKAVQCLMLVSIWGCVGVGGVHVPTEWKSDQKGNVRNLVQDNKHQNSAKNEQAKPQIQVFTVYNPFLTNFPDLGPTSKPVMYFQPQPAQIVSPLVEPQSNLPPLQHPRYPAVQASTDLYQRRSDQKPPRTHYLKVQNQQPFPNNVLRIKPATLGHSDVGLLTTNFNDGIFKEYPQKVGPSLPNPQLPNANNYHQLGPINGVQPLKFVVPASDHNAALDPLGLQLKQGIESIELTTKNEPVFFVTEGYRNVLVQGSNKKKKYPAPQKKAESKKVFNKNKEDDAKSYGIDRKDNNEPDADKKHEFAGLQEYTRDGQRSRAADFEVKNYRDDSLHEPQAVDWETERETDDPEKLSDDDDKLIDDDDKDKLESEDDEEEEYEEEGNDSEEEPEEQEAKDETDPELKLPDNEHAEPKPIPTKPIYPGEGQWAKPKLKHRPHISQHRFIQPVETGEKPDGYDVFEDLQQYFNNRQGNVEQSFSKNEAPNALKFNYIQPIKSPNPVNQLVTYNPFAEFNNLNSQNPYRFNPNAVGPSKVPVMQSNININGVYGTIGNADAQIPFFIVPNNNVNNNAKTNDYSEDEDDGEETGEDEAEEFVPVRVYAQVRNSEDVKHEPRKPEEDGRLKEVIKDSKVQTVYSEEGYEDSAYDHAGQEKKAEEDRDELAFQKEKEARGKPKSAEGKDSDARHSKKVHHSETVTPFSDSIASDSRVSFNTTTKANEDDDDATSGEETEDKNDADTELEIESEVKVVVQPNNSTQAHKYVKIYPKETKEFLENDESKLITVNSTERSEAAKEEAEKTSDKDGGELSRKKRGAEDGPEVESVDISFIDKINHTFAPPKPPEGLNEEKYPYYNKPEIYRESPLRYAVNMKHVPVKRPGELSFYKKADKFACPELVRDVDPIPEHVKNKHDKKPESDEDDDDDDEESDREFPDPPKTPRIELGDKIDCLKLRYFGDNPLDSPFFKEKTVGPVESIFAELDHQANQIKNIKNTDKPKDEEKTDSGATDKTDIVHSASSKVGTRLRSNSLFSFENENAESIRSNKKVIKPQSSRNSIRSETKPTPASVVTLITTPRYTIKLTPNNIYDQIKLLDHLPEDDGGRERETTTNRLETTTAKKRRETTTTERIKTTTAKKRRETTTKRLETTTTKKATTKRPETTTIKRKPVIVTTERVVRRTVPKETDSRRQPKVVKEETAEEKEATKLQDPIVLEPEALRRRKARPRQPLYQIFDVNKFLTTTPFTLIGAASNTVLPKYKVMSEVFYKDDIKPSEQLNVFADVLNNIKDSSRLEAEPEVAASNFGEPLTVTVSSLDEPAATPPAVRVKKFQTDSSNHDPKNYHDVSNRIIPASTPKSNGNVSKRRRKPTTVTTSTTSRTNIQVPAHDVPSNHQPYVIDVIDDTNDIVGLVPPKSHHYRTIVLDDEPRVNVTSELLEEVQEGATERTSHKYPAPVSEANHEVPPTRSMNKYYFLGLKPPAHQRAKPYSEFGNNNIQINDKLLRKRVAHVGLSRTRRHANRPAYAELSRNRGKQNEDEEKGAVVSDDFDDYVPHRPINFHYDEKIGRIVYHSKPEESKPEEEEEEYEEIEVQETPGVYLERAEDATHPTPEKVTTKELLATATPPPEGKGLLDFVVKLKNNPGYQHIPDPTTQKPGSVTAATEAFATVDPKSTDPPPFLSIISKVKSDKTYKFIEDPKESESKTLSKSTTPEPEIEEESKAEEETIQSSSGKTHSRKVRQTNFNIFNIGAFLPKIHNPIIITTTTTTTNRPTIFIKQQRVVGGLSPRQTTMNDITREYRRQVALYKFIKKRIQNARDGQSQDLGNIQIFDIGDYLPKIKSIVPKTSVDYSRYKTIERPHNIRNNNAAEGTNVQEIKEEAVSRPPAQTERTQTVPRPETTAAEAAPGTTQRIVQLRRGTRPTTQSIIDETSGSTEAAAAATRRIVNRKRPLPSGFRGTRPTTVAAEAKEASEQVEKVYPQYQSTEPTQAASHDAARRVYRKRPVRIRHTTERDEESEETADRIARSLEDGHLATSNSEDGTEAGVNNQSTEEIKKRRKREILAESSATVIEIINKDYNRTQPHGGNYKEKNDEAVSSEEQATWNNNGESKIILLEASDNEDEATGNKQLEKADSKESDNVKIVDDNFDKNKKHGGNYKEEEEEDEADNENVSKDSNKKESASIINENYAKDKKHGGNYKKDFEEEDVDDDKVGKSSKSSVAVGNNNYDKGKKHGGNYKEDHEEEYLDIDSIGKASENKNREEIVVIANEHFNTTKNETVDRQGNEEATESSVTIINEDYEKTKRNGRIYKKEEEETDNNSSEEVTESSNKEEKVIIANEYNKEETAGVKIEEAPASSNKNDSVVITNEDYDETKKHGGNYKKEDDDEDIPSEATKSSNKKDSVVIMDENYDKTKKHGGNYKKEDEDEEIPREATEGSNKKDSVVIMNKDYDKNKKHGGNYKREYDEEEIDGQGVEEATGSSDKKDSVVIVNNDYDKNKKHGGNYKREYDEEEIEEAIGSSDKKSIVDILNQNYNKTENHGDNHEKKQDKTIIEDLEAIDSSNKKESVVIVTETYDKAKEHEEEQIDNDKVVEVTESSNTKESTIITNENNDKIIKYEADNKKDQSKKEKKEKEIENNDKKNKHEKKGIIKNIYLKNNTKEELPGEIKEKGSVEVVKHGDNYKNRQEDIEDSKNDDNLKIISDNYDKTKKHSDFEDINKEEEDIEDIFNKMFDKAKTYYQEEKDGEIKGGFSEDKKDDDEEIINESYDKTKKQGDDYQEMQEEELSENVKEKAAGDDVVEIMDEDYDKTKKHGGNYRKELEEEKSDVEKEYDESKKNSDNYKEEVDFDIPDAATEDDKVFQQPDVFHGKMASESNTGPVVEILDQEAVEDVAVSVDAPQPVLDKNPETPQIRVPRSKPARPLPRLSDIVPKPDHFYSDPQLPKQVNNLGLERPPPARLASDEVAELAARGDSAASTEAGRRRSLADEDKTTSTKKPIFIKDPGKRLYFYAKV